MDSSDLTDAQLAALKTSLGHHIRCMHKLVERMEKVGWDRNDDLYRKAVPARDTGGSAIDGAALRRMRRHGEGGKKTEVLLGSQHPSDVK